MGISIQYRTDDKSAAAICNFRHKLTLVLCYVPFICHLSRFTFSLQRTVFFPTVLLLCIIFAVMCSTLCITVHNMLDDLIQKK